MEGPRTLSIASCVGGGPMERLAAALPAHGCEARLIQQFTPETWRWLISNGSAGRFASRLVSHAGFPVHTLFQAALRPSRVLVPTTNPFILPTVMVLGRGIHRRPVVPLVYDLYPDALEAAGMERLDALKALAESANRYCFGHADGVVFIGRRMGEHARKRYGEPRRWIVLETGASMAEMEAAAAPESAETDLERWCHHRSVISYVGNMGRVHDWETLAESIPQVLRRQKLAKAGIVIAASGPGAEVLRQRWSGRSPDDVRFEPPLADRPWARLLLRTSISVVTLKESARYTSIPSKTFSAMAAGNAIVAVAPRESDLGDLVVENGCGVVVRPGDVDGLTATLLDLLTDDSRLRTLRDNAVRAVRERYDIGILARRWCTFLSEVTGQPFGRPVSEDPVPGVREAS